MPHFNLLGTIATVKPIPRDRLSFATVQLSDRDPNSPAFDQFAGKRQRRNSAIASTP